MKKKIILVLVALVMMGAGAGAWFLISHRPRDYTAGQIMQDYKTTWQDNNWQVDFPKVGALLSVHEQYGWSGDGESLAVFRLTDFASLKGFLAGISADDKTIFIESLGEMNVPKNGQPNFAHALLFKIYKNNESDGSYFDYFYMIADKQSKCLYVLPIHI
jgi:hypothetical protein